MKSPFRKRLVFNETEQITAERWISGGMFSFLSNNTYSLITPFLVFDLDLRHTFSIGEWEDFQRSEWRKSVFGEMWVMVVLVRYAYSLFVFIL